MTLEELLQMMNRQPIQESTITGQPSQLPMQQPQQPPAGAFMPQQQPDMMTTIINQMQQSGALKDLMTQYQKEVLDDKLIGPDLLGKLTGGKGQGGIFGLGIQPTDVLMFGLGSLLTRNLPQDKAIATTMQMATLPSKYRQQQRQNLQQMMQEAIAVATRQQIANQPMGVAGGVFNPPTGQFQRTQPLSNQERAVMGAQTPEDLMVALGLRTPSAVPGQAAAASGASELAKQSVRQPFEVEKEQRSLADRRKIIETAAAVRRQDPTAMAKNVEMVEQRLGRKLNEKELLQMLLKSDENILQQLLSSALGGGGGSGGNVSPEAADLLRRQREGK